MVSARIPIALLLATLALPAGAAVLYKSVSPTGVVEFSDTPPKGESKIIEQREVGAAITALPGMPPLASAPAPNATGMEALANDGEVLNAAAQVDLAEHAFALARRDLWSATDALKLRKVARTTSDDQRIDYYKRGVALARQNLIDVMKRRAAALAVPGAPIVTKIASR